MSAIVGIMGPNLPPDGVVRRMLRAMGARGADEMELWRGPGAVLGVSRYAWESAPHLAGGSLVVDAGDCVVVADASIYYRDDLRGKLNARGVAATASQTPTELVLAAYRAWGEAAAQHLEGDFAFIVWDRRSQRVTCSRDFGGKRPLHFAEVNGSFVVASLVSGVVEHPECPSDLNLAVLAETLAQFWQGGDDTAYKSVRELIGGNTCTWCAGSQARLRPNWTPPPIARGTASSFEQGAEELRELLKASVAERLAPEGLTAVWMSGGWDSSSVFAAGQAVLAENARGRELRPVSISYPEGDPGREDELITAISNHWNAPIEWIDVESIPLFDRPLEGARKRDIPFAHTYEHWNRALATTSRAAGARIAFDGNGGDQLFQVSDIFLADLLRQGQLLALAREWTVKGGSGVGTFMRWVVAPNLPSPVLRGIQALRGRERTDYLERDLPKWVRPEFAHRAGLRERELARMPRRDGDIGWRREAHFYLAAPTFPRAFQCLGGFGLEAGIELRSPLYDRRIVEFASARPRDERNAGRETKRLLRRAMRGLLPDHVLAPRPYRTGITTAYSDRRMRTAFPDLVKYLLHAPILADLGIIEPEILRHAWAKYLKNGALDLKIPLFLTLHVELWLRSRLQPGPSNGPAQAPRRVPAGARP